MATGSKQILCLFVITCAYGMKDISDQFLQSIERTRITPKPGRHVCITESVISRPVPVMQTYKKPVYTSRPRDCPNLAKCPQYDVKYVLANRTVYQLQRFSKFEHRCCPGWTKTDKRGKGCMGAICKQGCGEFGVCIKPDTCQCQTGFSGDMCDTDIDECKGRDHGCNQICKNTAGSYMCACQEGFVLASDGRTCNFCFTCQKEYTDMMDMIATLQNDLMTAQMVKQTQKEEDKRNMKEEIEELKQEVLHLHQKNEEVEAIHLNATLSLVQLESDMGVLYQENKQKEDDKTNMKEEIEELKQEVLHLHQKNEEVEAMNLNATSSLVQLKSDMGVLYHENTQKEEDKRSMKEEIEKLKQEVLHLHQKNEEVEAMHVNTTSSLVQLKNDMGVLYQENQELKEVIENLEKNQTALVEDVEVLKLAPPPPKPTPAKASTTPRLTTPVTTTSTRRTTTQNSFGIRFDPYVMMVSLSNQIGLLEEKLDLCSCHERRPYK